MSHPRPIELIEYVAGHCGNAEVVREHLRECAACAEYVRSVQETWDALGQLPSEQLSADLLPRIEQALGRAEVQNRSAVAWFSRLRIAAAVMLALGIGHLAARGVRPDAPEIDPGQAAESIHLDFAGWRSASSLAELILAGPDEPSIGGNG